MSSLVSSSFLKEVIDRNAIAVSPEILLTDAIALMHPSPASRKSCALVQSQGKLVGILSERDIVKLTARGIDIGAVRVGEVMSKDLIVLRESEDCDLLSVLSRFQAHRIRHLPVLNANDSPIGVVTQDSIRAYLQPTDLLKLRRVGEVMSSNVICAEPTISLREIAQLMDEHRISCVAIARSNGEENSSALHPIGILTERDIVQLQVFGVDFEATLAQTAMSTPLFCLHPDDSLLKARQEMQRLQVRRLVVVGSEGELAGILTQTSLLRSLDPTEMYGVVQALQKKLSVLESVNCDLLQSRNRQLEAQVQERTARLQEQAEKDRLLADLAQQIRQSLNVKEILNIAVVEVRRLLKVERVLICRWKAQGSGTVAVESVRESQRSMLGQPLTGAGLADSLGIDSLQQGRIQAIVDLKECDVKPAYARFLSQFQSRAHLIVPIWQGDRLWGLLLAHQCSQPRAWQQLEIEFLEKLATHLGIAVRQAELYEQAQIELRDRRQAEIALKQLNEELENRVKERTAQLQALNDALQEEIVDRKQAELAILHQSKALANFSASLKQLHRLNTTHYQQFETLFADYLQAGCEIFCLETGIISKIEDLSYTIRSVRSTIDGLAVGSVFNLKNTYCAAVIRERRAVSYNCVGAMESLRQHPVYQSLKLEAYIGTPILVGDRIYGTLNFSSTQARAKPFETYELEIIELMAQSIGKFIAAHRLERDRQEAEKALRESQHFIERIAESTPNILYLYDLTVGKVVYVNRNVAVILGYTSPDLRSMGSGLFPALIHPQDSRKLLKQVRKFRQTHEGDVLEVAYRIKHANGGWRWLMGRHTVFNRTGEGQPQQILGTATDITQLKQTEEALRQANAQLRQQTIRDPLTGLFNRRYLEESLQREMHRAYRQHNPVGIIMLDIDRFKNFNDNFGHEAGDLVLQKLGCFLQDNLRSSDIVCRYGGEEFTIILPDASLDNTRARAEQLRRGIKQLPLDYQGRSLGQITLSLGVTCFLSGGETADELLRRADLALYQAKREGRDRVVDK